MSVPSPQRLQWRLRERMNAVGIHTATDLHERLKRLDDGAVQYAQLARMIHQPPARLNLRTLELLTIVLGCGVGELLAAGPDHSYGIN